MAQRYRGVQRTPSGRYQGHATGERGQSWYLGTWSTRREAAIAVDRATLHFGREDLGLNLPKESRHLGPLSPPELVLAARLAMKKVKYSSRYHGVCFLKRLHRWQAFAHFPPQSSGWAPPVHLGNFRSERDAAIARDRFVLGTYESDVPLNFPKARLKPASQAELIDWAHRLKLDPKAGKYEGVTTRLWNSSVPWTATLGLDGRVLSLGAWSTAKEAATAHDRAALYYLGDDAFLNFPKLAKKMPPTSAQRLRAEATSKRKKKTSSRYVGVWWETRSRRWTAAVRGQAEYQFVGKFDDEEQAAIERDKAAIRILGEQAKLNFHPRTGEEVFGLRLRDLEAERSPRRKQPRSARSSANVKRH